MICRINLASRNRALAQLDAKRGKNEVVDYVGENHRNTPTQNRNRIMQYIPCHHHQSWGACHCGLSANSEAESTSGVLSAVGYGVDSGVKSGVGSGVGPGVGSGMGSGVE